MKKMWEALHHIYLIHWVLSSVPLGISFAISVVDGIEKLDLLLIVVGLMASIGVLGVFIYRSWPTEVKPPAIQGASLDVRTGIRSKGGIVNLDNVSIKNQTTSLDLVESSLDGKNIDIR
jgi:hypothetical protein